MCPSDDFKKNGESCKRDEQDKKQEKKPCSRKNEVYSRVVGYIRPVDDWNDAKKEEFDDRKPYEVDGKDDTACNDNKKDIDCGDEGTDAH